MNNRTAAPSSAASKTSISRVGRARRALALFLVQALILQPAFAASVVHDQPGTPERCVHARRLMVDE